MKSQFFITRIVSTLVFVGLIGYQSTGPVLAQYSPYNTDQLVACIAKPIKDVLQLFGTSLLSEAQIIEMAVNDYMERTRCAADLAMLQGRQVTPSDLEKAEQQYRSAITQQLNLYKESKAKQNLPKPVDSRPSSQQPQHQPKTTAYTCSAITQSRAIGLTILRAELDEIRFHTRVDSESYWDRVRANMAAHWAGVRANLARTSAEMKANAQAPGRRARAELKEMAEEMRANAKAPGIAMRAEIEAQKEALKAAAEAPGIAMRAELEAQREALQVAAKASGLAMGAEIEAQKEALKAAAEAPGIAMRAEIEAQKNKLLADAKASGIAMKAIIAAQKKYFQDMKDEVKRQRQEYKKIMERFWKELAEPDHGISIEEYDRLTAELDTTLAEYQAETDRILAASGCGR